MQEKAADDGAEGVEDRHAQNQEGDEHGDGRGPLAQAHQGQSAQDEAHEQGAAVPHEGLGRMEVPGQEAQGGGGQDAGQSGGYRFALRQADDGRGHGGDGGDPAGQTVHAVDQVDGVAHAHQPHYGDGDAQDAQGNGAAGKGIGDEADGKARGHQDQRGHELPRQLEFGGDVLVVVDEPGQKDHAACDQHGGYLTRIHAQQQGPGHEAEIDGDAADPRRGSGVHLAGIGHIHDMQFMGQPDGRPRHGQGYREGSGHSQPNTHLRSLTDIPQPIMQEYYYLFSHFYPRFVNWFMVRPKS